MKFCSNPLCLFHLDSEPGQTSLTYQVGDKAMTVRRLEILQHVGPEINPRRFEFCEMCANVLAMTFGRNHKQKT